MRNHADEASLRELLEELFELTDTGLRTVTANIELAVAQAWFVRSVDMIRAALLLHDRGLGSVAHPLVRSAMEHVVGVLWLRDIGTDALGGLSNNHQKWARNVKRAVALANEMGVQPARQDWSPELDALIDEIEQQANAPTAPGEWHIVDRFRVAKQFDLYVAWLSETASSHATQASATPYLKFDDYRIVLLRPPQEPDFEALISRCAVVALIGFRAMGETLNSDYWRASVDRLEAAITAAFQQAGSSRPADEPSDNGSLGRFGGSYDPFSSMPASDA